MRKQKRKLLPLQLFNFRQLATQLADRTEIIGDWERSAARIKKKKAKECDKLLIELHVLTNQMYQRKTQDLYYTAA